MFAFISYEVTNENIDDLFNGKIYIDTYFSKYIDERNINSFKKFISDLLRVNCNEIKIKSISIPDCDIMWKSITSNYSDQLEECEEE